MKIKGQTKCQRPVSSLLFLLIFIVYCIYSTIRNLILSREFPSLIGNKIFFIFFKKTLAFLNFLLYNITCRLTLGYRQTVRHWTLTPAFSRFESLWASFKPLHCEVVFFFLRLSKFICKTKNIFIVCNPISYFIQLLGLKA